MLFCVENNSGVGGSVCFILVLFVCIAICFGHSVLMSIVQCVVRGSHCRITLSWTMDDDKVICVYCTGERDELG